jgi:FkbM family methyltransferase
MKLHQIPRKIVKRLLYHIHKLLGKDSLSGAKIISRNDLEEIGSDYGGWIVPTRLLDSDSICYCVGCGEDISFDLGLIDSFGCHVYGFDPTPRAIAHVKDAAGGNQKYHFYDIGLWDKEDTLRFFVPKNPDHVSHSLLNLQKTEEYISVNVKRLSHLMKELGHQKIDLLKIDIEGAEYKVIESIIEDDINVRVLCVEYDECFNPLDAEYRDRIRKSVNSLIKNGYSLVCNQGNGNYTFVKDA